MTPRSSTLVLVCTLTWAALVGCSCSSSNDDQNPCEDGSPSQCKSLTVAQTCEQGAWRTKACGENEVCHQGKCQSNECNESAFSPGCIGTEARTVCVDSLIIAEPCPSETTCNVMNGQCVTNSDEDLHCTGQSTICDGETFKRCVNDLWQKQDCAASNMYCDIENGGCYNPCEGKPPCQTGQFCRKDGRCSPQVFETVWKISADNLRLTLPFYSEFGKNTCDAKILWGDEPTDSDFANATHVTDCTTPDNLTHTYAKPGEYHVKLIGTYQGWGQPPGGGKQHAFALDRLVAIESFGPVGITQRAFYGVSNIRLPQTDTPDSTQWHNATNLFQDAAEFNGKIGDWDTSNVTTMNGMFWGAKAFNQPIGSWNTSKVTDMTSMFAQAQAFNQPIGTWDVARVTSFASMFFGATAFDTDIEKWDISAATTLQEMFADATAFNQSLKKWNTKGVTTMARMFAGASVFNQPLDTWDTSNVKDFTEMFFKAVAFNQPLSQWNTSKCTLMTGMLQGAKAFNQPVENWDTSNVTDMRAMFLDAAVFNQPISKWNVKQVKTMNNMLEAAEKFNQDLSSWALHEKVTLTRIFADSGLSKENYCKLIQLPVWKDRLNELGIGFPCE